jgi:hypothetical protein
MNNKNILKLACNIIGIFFLFQAVSQFKIFALFSAPIFMNENLLGNDYRENEYFSLFIQLSNIFFDLAIAVILLFRADWILNRLDWKSDDEVALFPLQRVVLIELTVIAVGIFVFARAVPALLSSVVEYITLNKRDNDMVRLFWNSNNRAGQMIFALIELIVSIVLVSNGRSIAKRLERIGDINSGQTDENKLHSEQ